MKTKIILIVALLFFCDWSWSQEEDIEFKRRNFDDRKAFKEARNNLQEGDDLMEPKPFPQYQRAIPFYEKAYDFNPNNSHLNYQLGICYINTIEKFKALGHFQKAYELNPEGFPDIHYYLGQVHHLDESWDKAVEHYETFKETLHTRKEVDLIQDVEKRIKECGHGKEIVKEPIRIWVDNLGEKINSPYHEYGMIMTADGSEMFFTSRRPSSKGARGKKDPIDFDEDVFYSWKNANGDWVKALNIGEPINTKGHDAAVALNPDGSKMVIYIDDKGDGNLYESVRKGDEWSKPEKFNKEISGPYHEPSAWYSSDGKLLYFVSNRPREKRGDPIDKDIFVASWNEDKEKWDDVERLPENINSPYDEDGIFLHPDNKTLYFSSKGHNSMGGYDIFKSIRRSDGTWTDPENIGYPLNTPDDDVFFVVTASGRYAYMTSFRDGGLGGRDLYKVTFLGDVKTPLLNSENILLASSDVPVRAKVIEPKVEVKKSQVAILKGKVRDQETKDPVEADIELVDNQENIVVAEFKSDSKTGKYLVSLPSGKNYGIAVKAEGYLFHSENFDVSESSDYKEVEKVVDLKRMDIGQVIVLRNIFFDLNKASLRDESKSELDRLIKLLNENSSMRIEISGHTDTRGAASYNKKLSEDRAKSVVDYLIENDIDSDRLEYKGYGLEQPIISDEELKQLRGKKAVEEAHQENRRTEFKVLKN